jgi:hypothetical protein
MENWQSNAAQTPRFHLDTPHAVFVKQLPAQARPARRQMAVRQARDMRLPPGKKLVLSMRCERMSEAYR